MPLASVIIPDKWVGAYDLSWRGIICPPAYAHPAKFSRGLIERIVSHVFEQGWVQRGSQIVDPFGGVACGGIVCAYRRLRWVGVELEPRFIELAKSSFALHARHWTTLGCPQPVILQGDSRRLMSVVENYLKTTTVSPILESNQEVSHAPDGQMERSESGIASSKKHWEDRVGSEVKLLVGSPPYETDVVRERDIGKSQQGATQGKHAFDAYGQSPGQLAALPPGTLASAIVSSPPYEASPTTAGNVGNRMMKERWGQGKGLCVADGYGKSTGQLGQEAGNTFWSAAKLIVEQCYQLLPPGGHAIWVVKDFVRNKQRVDFTGDWLKLCEAVGFKLVCRHQALLVKTWEEPTLFEGTVRKERSRKSFFRRLCESKGSPRIDWEDVLCLVR